MSMPSTPANSPIWPLAAHSATVAPQPNGDFGGELLQHRRLFAQLDALRGPLEDAVALICEFLSHGAKLVLLGHGASQLVATLLCGEINRRARRWATSAPLHTVAVTADDGADSFVRASGRASDVALWLSGHGDSVSLLRSVSAAHRLGMANIAIVGSGGGAMRGLTDICLSVPYDDPMRVREAQLFLGHAMARQIDVALRPTAVALA